MNKLFTIACGSALLATAVSAQDVTAIKAGKAYLGGGKTIDNAVILIKDGRIADVGTDLDVPWNAKVLDASKQYVMPAWVVAHSYGGMDRANENMPVTPFLTVSDSLDPSSSYFTSCRRYGIGTVQVLPGNATVVGGRGMIVRPYGKTPEGMAVQELSAMKLSLQPKSRSRSQQVAQLRRALQDALDARKDWERRKKEFEQDKANGATTKEKFTDEIDPLKKPALDMLDRKMKAFLYVPSATDVPAAMRLVDEFKLDAVFVLGANCYKAVDLLKKASESGVGLILDPSLEICEKDPVTEEEELVCTAKVFHDAGLPFALSATSGSARRSRFRRPGTSSSSTHPALAMPWWQVATCVRWGMSERAAIDAFTVVPAKILGLDRQLGTIAKGKDANVQVLSAAPLEPESQVEYLVVEGRVLYDRSKDPRVKALTGKPTTGGTEGHR